MYKKLFLQLVLIAFWYSAMGQSNYLVGTSSVSIEPDNSIFSTALAGYGLPREGRFTISWSYVDNMPDITAVTSVNGQLYAATSDGELLAGKFDHEQISWKKAGKADNLKVLTSLEGKLYATNDKNKLLEATISEDKISWKRSGKVEKLNNITNLEGVLYAVDDEGKILKGTLKRGKILWEEMEKADKTGRIISLTSNNKRIYAVNEGDSLWAGEPRGNKISWVQIGRNNSLTYDINVKQIAVHNDRLFAVSEDNKLYINEHSTEGNISARAVAVKNADNTAVIVSLDLCGFDHSFTEGIKNRVSKERNIPQSAILINATHTHFTPVTQEWYALGPFYKTPDEDYLDMVKEGVVKAIGQALDNMAPSSIHFGRGTTDIGKNRRTGANPKAPYDNTLDVLKVENLNNKLSDVLFLTGCHPVFKNSGKATYTISGNYPATARKIIEENTTAVNAVFIQGLAGDINPKAGNYESTGEELAGDVLAVLNNNMDELKGDITYFMDTIKIPIEPWDVNRVRKFKNDNISKVGDIEAERNVRWSELMLERYDEGTVPSYLPVYVQTINIGNWKFVGLSREVVNEYGPAIRNIWPDKIVSVAGYCNDVTSYLPVDWHITTGVYEGEGSFFWYGAPGTFPVDVKDMIIERIKTLNR